MRGRVPPQWSRLAGGHLPQLNRRLLPCLLILLTTTAFTITRAAVNDLLPQINTPTIIPSTGGIVSDSMGNYYTCQGSDIYQTITLTGASSKWYTNAAVLDGCYGLAIESTGQYLFATGATNVYRFSLVDGTAAKVAMNNATSNAFDATTTGLVANLHGLAIDGVNTLYVFNNRDEPENRHAWSFPLDVSSSPGVWSIIVDNRLDFGMAETLAVNFVPGTVATTLLFTQGASTTVDGSQIGLIFLDANTTAQTNFSGPLTGIFPLSTPIYGLVHVSSSGSASTYYVAVGRSNVWVSIAVNSGDLSGSLTLNGVITFPNSGTFVGPIYSATYDQCYGSILFIANTTVQRIVHQPFVFYPSTHYPLNGDRTQTLALSFSPAALQPFKFNISTSSAPTTGYPHDGQQLTFQVEPGSNAMFYTYTSPNPSDISSTTFHINFAIQGTQPSQWISNPPQETMKEIVTSLNTDVIRQLVDRPASLADYQALKGATQIAIDSTLQRVYVINKRVVNVVSTSTGAITPLCTSGTNSVLVDLVTDDSYIYVVDSSNVYRCPLIGGTLTLYSIGGVPLATPVRGIAIATERSPALLYVTGGTNVQVLIAGLNSTAYVSGPVIGDAGGLDYPQSIVARPDGQQFWLNGPYQATSYTPLFSCQAILPVQSELNQLDGSFMCQLFTTSYTRVTAFTLRWDDIQAIIYQADGESHLNECRISQNGKCNAGLYPHVNTNLNPLSIVYRGGGSLFALTLDIGSNTNYILPRIERVASQSYSATFSIQKLYPSNDGYTGKMNYVRVQINSNTNAGFLMDGPATISLTCRDSSFLVVNDPTVTLTAYETFDFAFVPTRSGLVTCLISSFQAPDLVRITGLTNLFKYGSSITIRDHGVDLTINWRTFYSGSSNLLLWTTANNYLNGGAFLSITCPSLTVTPDRLCLQRSSGTFTITGGFYHLNTTCTATISGPHASLVNSLSSMAYNFVMPAAQGLRAPSGTPTSPIVVTIGSGYQFQISRYMVDGGVDVSMSYNCGADWDVAHVISPAQWSASNSIQSDAYVTWFFGQPGLVRCTSVYSYGNIGQTGLFQLLPDVYFQIVPLTPGSTPTVPVSNPAFHIDGVIPFGTITGSNETSTDYIFTVANPLNSAYGAGWGEYVNLFVTCSSSDYYGNLYPATISVSVSVIGTDPTITVYGGSQSGVGFRGISNSSAPGLARYNISVGPVPNGHPARISCEFLQNGFPYCGGFDSSFDIFVCAGDLSWMVGVPETIPIPILSQPGAFLDSDPLTITFSPPSSFWNYYGNTYIYYRCNQDGNSQAIPPVYWQGWNSHPVDTYFIPSSDNFHPGILTCVWDFGSFSGADYWHWHWPSFNIIIYGNVTLEVITPYPVTGTQSWMSGSLTDDTHFSISLLATNMASNQILNASLICSSGGRNFNVTGSGGSSATDGTVTFDSSALLLGPGVFDVAVPPFPTGDDSYLVSCYWEVSVNDGAGYILPSPFQFWMGPTQLQLVVQFDSNFTSLIAVGTESWFTITTSSGSGNILQSLILQLDCRSYCPNLMTGNVQNFTTELSGSFSSHVNGAHLSFVADRVGSVVCKWQIVGGTDAPHFIAPVDISLTVTALYNLDVTITGGPVSPIVSDEVGAVLYTPTAIQPQEGDFSIFNVTVAAPIRDIAYSLTCSNADVTAMGGDSVLGQQITWLSTTTEPGVYTIRVTNSVDGVSPFCEWSSSFSGGQVYTVPDFSFYVGPTVQLVSSFLDRPYGYGDTVTIGLTTLTKNSTNGFSVLVLCTTSSGIVSVSGSADFPSGPATLASVTIKGETTSSVSCSFAPLPSTSSEFRRFLLPPPILIQFVPGINWMMTVGGTIITNSQTPSVQFTTGTPTATITIEPATSIGHDDSIQFRLICTYGTLFAEVTPSATIRFTSQMQTMQTLQVQLPQTNTTTSLVGASLACTWMDVIQTGDGGGRFATPSSFGLIVGQLIRFPITPSSSDPGVIYATPSGSHASQQAWFMMTPTGCATGSSGVRFQANCDGNGLFGSIHWSKDNGNSASGSYSCNDDISFFISPTPYVGSLTCRFSIISGYIDAYQAPDPITVNICPRMGVWNISNINFTSDGKASVQIVPSMTPGPNGVEVSIVYATGTPVSIYPTKFFFPSGVVTPQTFNITVTPGSFVDAHSGGYFYVYGHNYDDSYGFLDTSRTFTFGTALSQSSTYQLQKTGSVCDGVIITLTIANPSTSVTAQLHCFGGWNGDQFPGSVDYGNGATSLTFIHNGLLTQNARVYGFDNLAGNLTCYWEFGGVDRHLFNNYDRFNVRLGAQADFIISRTIPSIMAGGTVMTFTIVPSIPINSSLTVSVYINNPASSSFLPTNQLTWSEGIPTPRIVSIYASTIADTFEIIFDVSDLDAFRFNTPAPIAITVIPMTSLTVVQPASMVIYSSGSFSISMTPIVTVPFDFTVHATCTGDVSLGTSSLPFTSGSTGGQSFSLTPTSLLANSDHSVSCSFTIDGPGSIYINSLSTVSFTYHISSPSATSSTGGSPTGTAASSTGSGTHISSSGSNSGSDSTSVGCIRMVLPSSFVYIMIGLVGWYFTQS